MAEPLESHLLAQTSGRQVQFWHKVRALPVTTRLPRPDATVVDVGAGAGVLGDILTRRHPDVRYRFFEPLDSMADQLEQRFGHDARLENSSACSAADIVTLLDVIEHVDDPSALLAPIVHASRPGTLFVITVPALNALWSGWDEQLGHRRRYTKRTLSAETRGLSLEVIEIAYLFPELLLPALVRKLRSPGGDDESRAEFPELPGWLDRLLFIGSSLTYKARRVWPAGTSLVLVARKR